MKRETEETMDKEKTNFKGSTAHIQPPVTPIPELDVPKTLPKPNIPYPSRLNDQKLHEKATNQMEKFFQIFQDLHFNISFVDALLLMPKFASTIKSLLTNKDKLFQLAKIPLNENFSPSTSGTLSSNTIPNPNGEMKAVITRSGLAYEGPLIPTESPLEKVDEQNTEEILDKEHSNSSGSTAQVQPPVVPISIPKPDIPRTQSKPTIPYPSRLNDQKLREKAINQMEKFFQIFHDLHFNISFADALLLMPKFASTIKSLLANKDKLFELAKVPLNENCSAMLLKKLPEKLGDLELTPTRMTLELADRSITRPKGVVEDVFVKVGKFHFPTDFVVVDFEADLRVPLILRRSFLRTSRALIDVYGEEITLRVNDESIAFNLNQTIRYSSTYDDTSVNRVDVIDVACEDFVQDVLDFQYNPKSSSPTLVSDDLISESDAYKVPIVKSSSPTLTPFGENLKVAEESKEKSSVKKPHELELKELPSHLEYAFLKDSNKLPVIIGKNLKVDEREALINVLKSYKRAIAWKISDIKGIDPRMRYPISDSPWVSPTHCVPKKGELELKDLPSHLEYAYLEGVEKLPVIIAKDLKDNEKEALLKVLKSLKRAIDWKINEEGDILLIEKLLNEDPCQLPPMNLNQAKSLIEEPEYSFNIGYEHFITTPVTELDEVAESSVKNLVPIPRYEHFITTPVTELDEVAESSVKNLVPIPSEYEVTSDDESEYNETIKDDTFLAFTTFTNPLFNDKDDFTIHDEDVPIEESKFDHLEEFSRALMPIHIAVEERIRKEHAKYIRLMERLITINPCPRPMENANTIVESLPSSLIPIQDNDSQREEIDIVTDTDELLPPGFENDDSEGEINVVEELRIDNSISNSKNELSDNEASDHDNLLFPRPPPELPDDEFDFELNFEEVISAVMNNIEELIDDECFENDDSEGEINVVEELRIDNSISNSKNELSDNEASDHDNLLFPRPPPEPPDDEFDFELNFEEVISAVMNNIEELIDDECFYPGREIDIFTNVEDDDYIPFMFVI
nr:hypothetical protein [Tanacetum cinerariifolium]